MAPEPELDQEAGLRQRIAVLEAELRQRATQDTGERRFHELVDGAPLMIWISGADAMCTFFNRAWLEFRGRKIEQEMGNGWTEGLHPDDRNHCLETYLKAFSARHPFRLQYRVQRANGEYCWIENAGVPMIEPDSVFAGFMGIAVDVSDRWRRVFTPDEESVRIVFALTASLGISYKTADSHRSRVLEKLGVHETASMVRYAIRAGLVEP